jgi:long-chain acyl-CoA synthetase
MNLATNLERSAYFFPDRPAVVDGQSETSYAQLNCQANRIATGLLKLGARPGDPIALCAPNSVGWLAFYFGCLKIGAVAVTLPRLVKGDELQALLGLAKPKIIYTGEDRLEDLEVLRGSGVLKQVIGKACDLDLRQLAEMGTASFRAFDRDRSDTAAVLFTGGTTGTPKGVMLSHENINTAIHHVVFNERSSELDRALCFLPFNHVFGQMHIMNATILSGGSIELLPAFDMERVLSVMASGRVTKLFAVPTVYVRLLAQEDLNEKLGSVRYCFSAAASMAEEVVRQWKERTGLAIYEAYGMTESASMVTYNHYHRHVVGSVGTPVGTVELDIRDAEGDPKPAGEEGEICVRGRNIMKGYLSAPEETQAVFWGEWFRTGDVGVITEDGYLYIVDRIKDMIITGGENVYPREIEERLYAHPAVQECTVIGLPDREWGERVTALIIPKPGRSLDTKELNRYLKTHLSPFKVPKEYRVVDDFPKSPAGKILKRALRSQILDSEHEKGRR